ncbi:MAG: DUF177 domain-containing protein [Clostridia bacterium]|nr:DUF177 domain-containing protein [Clostridia bacterium]
MILDLRPLLRGETDHIDIDYYLTPDPIDDITFDSDAHVFGRITDNAGYMRLALSAEVSYKGQCARCLKDVGCSFSVDFERTVCDEGTLSDDKARADEEDVYSDGYAIIHDGMLDIDEELREELVLSFPSKLLCSENCEGLCPMCGKPKSEGDCGCRKKEIDPRLAVLATLLHKNEEKGENQ